MSFQKLYGAQLNGAQVYKKTDFLNFGMMVAEISVKDAKKKNQKTRSFSPDRINDA